MQRLPQLAKKPQPASVLEPIIPGAQPAAPPAELSPDEAREWRILVSRMPQGWFPPETWPLLVLLCRNIVHARWLGFQLQALRAESRLVPDDQMKRADDLSRLHANAGRMVTKLSIKLRLIGQPREPSAGARQ